MPRLLAFFLALVSAVLLALPYHFSGLWPLAFFALVPLFYIFEGSGRTSILKLCTLCGFIYYVLLGYWLTYVNVFGFLILAAYLSLYFTAFGALAESFIISHRLRSTFAVAALWVFLEYVRGFLISGFPWALVAYSQWKNLSLIQLAEWVGSYGVSFLVVWTNVMIFRILKFSLGSRAARREGPGPFRFLLWLVAVLGILWGVGAWRLETREAFYHTDAPKAMIRISVVQGNIPQDQKWDERIKNIIFEKYKRLTLMAAMDNPDLIVWPETSFPGYLQDEPSMAAHLRQLVRQSRTELLFGVPTTSELDESLRFYNTAILHGLDGEEKARYHKVHLVPFGEYIPFESALGFLRNFFPIGRFTPGSEQTIFSLVTHAEKSKIATKFGVLICYEDIFPWLVRELCVNGADYVVNITNDAWFGKTAAPYQHAQASVFRAVENRVPVIRSTNTGLSCFISAEGRVMGSVKKNGEEIMVSGYKTQDLVLRKGRSFYTRFGDLFFWVVLVILFFSFRDRHKSRGYSKI